MEAMHYSYNKKYIWRSDICKNRSTKIVIIGIYKIHLGIIHENYSTRSQAKMNQTWRRVWSLSVWFKSAHPTSDALWLVARIINCSRHNETVPAAREEQGADKLAHPSTHTADRLGVMTGATIAACPPITLGRQRNEMDSLILPFHNGVWKTPPHLTSR